MNETVEIMQIAIGLALVFISIQGSALAIMYGGKWGYVMGLALTVLILWVNIPLLDPYLADMRDKGIRVSWFDLPIAIPIIAAAGAVIIGTLGRIKMIGNRVEWLSSAILTVALYNIQAFGSLFQVVDLI